MKEEYYLIPKEALDLISRQLEVLSETNNCGLTNDKAKEILSFKLIDLSDKTIESKAKKYGVDSNESEITPLKLYRSNLEERSQFDYQQALKDIKK